MPKRTYDDMDQSLSNKKRKINDLKTIHFDLEIIYGLTNNMNNINLNR